MATLALTVRIETPAATERFIRQVSYEPLPTDLIQPWPTAPALGIKQRVWEPIGLLAVVLHELVLVNTAGKQPQVRDGYPLARPWPEVRDALLSAGWGEARRR